MRVHTPEQRQQDASGLLAAFRLNLTALSLISVFVGLFLVLTAVQAALVRRRTEFGVLRSLGATPRQVLGLIVAEAATVGLVGVVLGVPLGWLAALRNLDSVSGTLTNIYVLEGIETPDPAAAGGAAGAWAWAWRARWSAPSARPWTWRAATPARCWPR